MIKIEKYEKINKTSATPVAKAWRSSTHACLVDESQYFLLFSSIPFNNMLIVKFLGVGFKHFLPNFTFPAIFFAGGSGF